MFCSSSSSCTLAIIYGSDCKIAYCNSTTWVEITHDKQSYCDIVFSNNYLFALTQDGFIEVWDVCRQIPERLSIQGEASKVFPAKVVRTACPAVFCGGVMDEYSYVVEELKGS
ncbi:hypothetical protein Ahy_A06g030190 [Arachis hypogaea]|uniref:KIB1-4 beta-propeller domain-containing protein n=1 Tax=Arachis hypogaea TaxID=3818 RepID=A0A445CVJ0_ARAHY|nr:hypothetical protein Ahy_A06g030190 [Arachis hypogaea]